MNINLVDAKFHHHDIMNTPKRRENARASVVILFTSEKICVRVKGQAFSAEYENRLIKYLYAVRF